MGGVTRDVIRITQLTQAVLEPPPQLIIGLFKLPKRSKRVIEQRLPFVGTSLKPLPLRPVGTEGLLGGWSFPKAHLLNTHEENKALEFGQYDTGYLHQIHWSQ